MAEREAGMMCCVGVQGVGKTYRHMHTIKDYVKDKVYNKVKGRKVLIFDTNGEFTEQQFKNNDIDTVKPKLIALKDIKDWCISPNIDVRRIDAKSVGIADKKVILAYIIKNFRNGLLVIEDINTYILSITHMDEIVGGIVNLRHRAVDVLISYQSLRAVEPRILSNSRWIRMHYQSGLTEDVKGKLGNPELFKIAELLVKNRYNSADKRFFVYIHNFGNKIQGNFTKHEFDLALEQYLRLNKKFIKEAMSVNRIKEDEAIQLLSKQLYGQYWGNQ